jgi:hypothetical protein
MIKQTLYEILQVLSISIFEKVPVNQLFTEYQLQYFKEQSDNLENAEHTDPLKGFESMIF